jgi:hypothetical protein
MKASKQVAVDDAPRVKIVDGNEGESALLINRGPDSVYVGWATATTTPTASAPRLTRPPSTVWSSSRGPLAR